MSSPPVSYPHLKTVFTITPALLDKGYREIARFTGNSNFSSEKDCINGYLNAFQSHGISLEHPMIYETNMSKESAFKAAKMCIRDRSLWNFAFQILPVPTVMPALLL